MIILGTNSIKDTGFDVANSLRLNSGDSAQMNKTLGTATDVDKYTISMWVKRSRLAHRQMMMRVINPSSTSTYAFLEFQSDDKIGTNDYNGSGDIAKVTNRAFRDTSAWYHIVLALDSTQSTASDRSKLYINGVLETSFSTDSGGSQNQDLMGNTSGKNIYIGGDGGQDARYCGLYMTEVVFIDGQQLDPTSFGEFDSDSNIWKPIDVSGLTFGNNGFYLDFEDSSALGNDAAGSNNFTANNLTAIDQSTDTCTNNFATLNPLDTFYAGGTLSEGNVKVVTGATETGSYTSTIGITSGKWYAEMKAVTIVNNFAQFGIKGRTSVNGSVGSPADGYAYYAYQGKKVNSNNETAYGASWRDGDIIGCAVDLDNNKIYWSKNGTWQNSGDPESGSTGTGSAFNLSTTPLHGAYFFACSDEDNGSGTANTFELNFGNPSFAISSGNTDGNGYGNFEYAVPSGYYSLNTKNLAEYG